MPTDAGWAKRVVSWTEGDTLCLSVPFTWMVAEARALAAEHDGPVVAGGPGMMLLHPDGCEWAEVGATTPRDVLADHHPEATFTTRGCVNYCPYCAVRRVEGRFRELREWAPKRLVCDANFLAASEAHIRRAVERLRHISGVEFNQGLSAPRFKGARLDALRSLTSPRLRFAFDRAEEEGPVADAIARAKKLRMSIRGVYVLYGYDDSEDEAVARMELVRSWGVRPFPMRYQPLDTTRRNAYVAPGWTQFQLRRFSSYYHRLRWVEHIPYEDYGRGNLSRRQLELW